MTSLRPYHSKLAINSSCEIKLKPLISLLELFPKNYRYVTFLTKTKNVLKLHVGYCQLCKNHTEFSLEIAQNVFIKYYK